MDTTPDTLCVAQTCAYLTAGFNDAWREGPNKLISDGKYENWADRHGGHCGVVEFLAECALGIETAFAKENWGSCEFDGVYVYDLIEPLGGWIVQQDVEIVVDEVVDEARMRYTANAVALKLEGTTAFERHADRFIADLDRDFSLNLKP